VSHADALRKRLASRTARVGVVGLGYVGLPLAVELDYDMVLKSARLIVDTRNAIAGRHPHVFKLGAPAPVMQIAIPGGREKAVV
jgi:UDP-N-acetyl-D-mannosaminuronate dehydrogenase